MGARRSVAAGELQRKSSEARRLLTSAGFAANETHLEKWRTVGMGIAAIGASTLVAV
jgi:hypothetical protein